jgi:outer membrane protein assembly factor BamA
MRIMSISMATKCGRLFIAVFIVLISVATPRAQYTLTYDFVDKGTSISTQTLNLDTSFANLEAASLYVKKLPAFLLARGYPAASVDSIAYSDSSGFVSLFVGRRYLLGSVNVDSIDGSLLERVGWFNRRKQLSFQEFQLSQERLLDEFEKAGYPFAAVSLQDVTIIGDTIFGRLHIDKGLQYKIDSIRKYGPVRIKKYFLEKYLGIPAGSFYNRDKLDNISRRLLELPYLQEERPWDLTTLGTGATLNLYLIPKRSSQVNFLVGFLPGTGIERKLQLTGDINLNLKNALGSGESILVNWQQLQPKSPRINLGYQHPYIFRSQFGIDFLFDLLKRDSSYLQINGQLGIQYLLGANQSGKIFIQNYRSYLLPGAFDTNTVRQTKQLPQDIDMSLVSLGVDYELYNTDYRFNPRKGNELRLIVSAGSKKITMNNEILELKDPSSPGFNFRSLYDSIKPKSYQFRSSVAFAHFFPMGKRNTLKTGLQAGIITSQQIFRNELFQLGGYRLLRGFSEQSIFADRYAVATAEFRILSDRNSFLFGFVDVGLTRTKYQSLNFKNNFAATGVGGSFETKFGLLNISYAIGKRNDVKFDLRQASKIHFGYINFF